MAEEGDTNLEKREKDHEKLLNMRILHLQEQLKEKDEQLEHFEIQFKKLYEDFNFNLEIIYERDREIQLLNQRLQKLTELNSSKDAEIREMKQNSLRLSQLEQENAMLTKKLDSLTQGRNPSPRLDPRPPRIEYKNLLKDNRNMMTKKNTYINNSIYSEKNQENPPKEDGIIDTLARPIVELNFDLESRIKALEAENTTKDRKSASLSNSRNIDKSSEFNTEIIVAREKVKKQEKEIGELIKSLQVYKKTNDPGSRSKIRTYDDQITALNDDIERLRTGEIRSCSRTGQSEDGEKKYKPFVRPRSSFDKRFN
ncbi:hypothetical protein SteCoe_21176 [Stentor coeruleus]|uniref:Uncharacterized protein n=1 Tax=Stentor coeruleus TaxID=5963 RepID=A0A1R2BQB2_9CILI|nr:hypothetical protein SteCoe_21176 [Stentor coeruleus]